MSLQSMENVWTEYHLRLRRFVGRHVDDPAAADGLLGEIFLKIQNNVASLRAGANLQGWLYRIARNTLIDYYRAHRKAVEPPEWVASPEKDPPGNARKEIVECLVPMIQSLPEPYREAVILSEVKGLSQVEVAERQNLSVSGAKARIHRGRKLVKEMLSNPLQLGAFGTQGRVIE